MNHLILILWGQVEVVQWHKKATKQAHQETQIHSVFEVGRQVQDFKVQLAQMLVDKCDERFLYNLKLLGCVIEKRVKSITFTSHANIVVDGCDLLLKLFSCQFAGGFLHQHNCHRDIFRQSDGRTEVTNECNKQVQDCN